MLIAINRRAPVAVVLPRQLLGFCAMSNYAWRWLCKYKRRYGVVP